LAVVHVIQSLVIDPQRIQKHDEVILKGSLHDSLLKIPAGRCVDFVRKDEDGGVSATSTDEINILHQEKLSKSSHRVIKLSPTKKPLVTVRKLEKAGSQIGPLSDSSQWR
jgi:hypothetical protein